MRYRDIQRAFVRSAAIVMCLTLLSSCAMSLGGTVGVVRDGVEPAGVDQSDSVVEAARPKAFWEREDVLAELPVKPPLKPDGHYDYSVPGYQKLDVCPWIYREKLYKPGLARHEIYESSEFANHGGCTFRKDPIEQRFEKFEFITTGTFVVNRALREVVVSEQIDPQRWYLVAKEPLEDESVCLYVEEAPIGKAYVLIYSLTPKFTQRQACEDAKNYFDLFYRKPEYSHVAR